MTLHRANSLVLTIVLLISSWSAFGHAASRAEGIATTLSGVRVIGLGHHSEDGTAMAEQEQMQREVDTWWQKGPVGFSLQVYDSFTSGSNAAYSAARYIRRKFHSGPRDYAFDPELFIQKHKHLIPFDQQGPLRSAWNETEAMMFVEDYQESVRKQQLVQMRGSMTGYIAEMTASGVIPVAVLTLFFVWRRKMAKTLSNQTAAH